MLAGSELLDNLLCMPDYNPTVRQLALSERLMRLSDIYKIYIPSDMSIEIYNKLYLATMMSLQKKNSLDMVRQQNENFRAMNLHDGYRGIIGGADSFSIIGTSGIGKSSAIERAVSLIDKECLNSKENPQIIPCISVQCPFDCSPKGMLLEILRSVDLQLETKYYERSQRAGVTTDILIGTVAQVAINHIGLLIIDEIQHVSGHKNGKTLIGMLIQLINISGISICMVGTPECIPFFEQAMQLARRSMGMKYEAIIFNDYFQEFCRTVYRYQYVSEASEISDAEIEWLYEHSAGIISVVISLIHDAQEIAILNGTEKLSLSTLNEAYHKRLSLMHGFIDDSKPVKGKPKAKKTKQVSVSSPIIVDGEYISIPEMVTKAKNEGQEVVNFMCAYGLITEVRVHTGGVS